MSTDLDVSEADFEWRDAFEVEGQAVCALLGAQTSDVRCLLQPIAAAPIARAQVQPLLEQSMTRLQALRQWLSASGEPACSPAFTVLKDLLAETCLSDTLSVDATLAHIDGCESFADMTRDELARVFWLKALVCSLGLDYEAAAAACARGAEESQAGSELQWQLLMLRAELKSDLGREFNQVEPLQQAIELYEQVLLPVTPPDVVPEKRAQIYDALGTAHAVLGLRHRGTRPTELAVAAFRSALELWTQAADGDAWAATQNRLGNALGFLGQRQRDVELLEESVAAFDAALEEQIARPASGAYASTYSNLAAVLQSLGQQKQDAKALKRAVDSYKSVLAVWSREHRPIMWAATMSNLGSALRLLGETRKGPRTLEQAVAAFTAALAVRTRDRLPHDWAMTQNNLGAALQALGERTEDELTLGKAVAAYRETVKELTADDVPMSWAMAMANLGVARRKLAELNGDIQIARRATDDIKSAIDIFRGASHAQLTELGEEQLSLARKLVAEIEAATAEHA